MAAIVFSAGVSVKRPAAVSGAIPAENARRSIMADPRGYMIERGMTEEQLAGIEFVVKVESKNTRYIPVAKPPEGTEISSDELVDIVGGVGASTVGSAATASTFASVVSCLSSLGCLSSAGSAGSH